MSDNSRAAVLGFDMGGLGLAMIGIALLFIGTCAVTPGGRNMEICAEACGEPGMKSGSAFHCECNAPEEQDVRAPGE